MQAKKSLVLIGVEDESQKAVLTLENDGELVQGRLRLYNFPREVDGIISLGFYHNGKVKKCGLVRMGQMLYSFKTEPDFDEPFSCAVVNFVGAQVKLILFGATQKDMSMEEQLSIISNDVLDKSSMGEVEQALDEAQVEYDDEMQAEIEKTITSVMAEDEDKCKTCKYKRCFFGEEEPVPDSEGQKRFIDEIKGQIDKLFATNPPETYLEEAIPSSKWVRVEYDGDGDYYILGLVYDESEKIKYVCYGVPGIYQKSPPTNLAGFPVWFPLDSEKKESFGYWLTYQDADTGESIKAVVE